MIIPLESFPSADSGEAVHGAVAKLLACTAAGSNKLQFSELLVVDSKDQYVGRLTIKAILSCYFPALFAADGKSIFAGKKEQFSDLAILLEDSFEARCKTQGALPVSKFMAPPLKPISSTTHCLHAAEIMLASNETYLPVVDNGGLVGVVQLNDIFQVLSGMCAL
jgi:CBS domain-containing protein